MPRLRASSLTHPQRGRDELLMREALTGAANGIGRTSPNPAVGAIIVQNGRIIARGWHRGAGQPHAEIEAISALADRQLARGATLYITLEPCSTHGRTPPCTAAIIERKFARVVFGATDPNPRHAGRAVGMLRNAGIDVKVGVLAAECGALNRGFNRWVTTGHPWVIAKWAMSLDGRLTRPSGEPPWLTSAAARADAMGLRARVDAILIGAGTLRADNPRLTVRGIRGARQPWRVVLSRKSGLPPDRHLFTDEHRDRTIVLSGMTLRAALRALGRRQITSVMIEGGGEILGQAFDGGLVDEIQCYLAPLVSGGTTPAVGGVGVAENPLRRKLFGARFRPIGSDVCLSALVAREPFQKSSCSGADM